MSSKSISTTSLQTLYRTDPENIKTNNKNKGASAKTYDATHRDNEIVSYSNEINKQCTS